MADRLPTTYRGTANKVRSLGWILRYPWKLFADSLGNYSADFSGLYWSDDCSEVDLSSPCVIPRLRYNNEPGTRFG